MILIGIGMLVVGVLLGAFLIYVWTRSKPVPPQLAPEPPQPTAERPSTRQRREVREIDMSALDEGLDRMNDVFERMNDVFDPFLGERRTTRRQRTGGGLFQTQTVTVTRTPATPEAPPVTLFDHLAKEDDAT